MKKTAVFLGVIIHCSALLAQDPVVLKYGNMISGQELKDNLSILASDALEGRETGQRGQKMAAAFIRAHFEESGLKGPVDGSYFQTVPLYTSAPGDTYVAFDRKKFRNFDQVIYFGTSDTGGEVTAPLVFIGNGREEDLKDVDVNGKAVLILTEATRSNLNNLPEVVRAREKGALMTFVCISGSEDEFKTLADQTKEFLYDGRLSLNRPKVASSGPGAFAVSNTFIEQIFGSTYSKLKLLADEKSKKNLKKLKPVTIRYKSSVNVKTVNAENVLGYLEGGDKKDELLVITAHYDHIGKYDSGKGDLINNGADDDGSGTVSVMQLAKVFAKAKEDGFGPRRSILFMTVSGEEMGLLGSDYYTRNPVFPLNQTVVNLNIDMVGRRDPQHRNSDPYVYVIGSDKLSMELHRINEWTNKTYTNLIFDYTYNDQNHPERLYYRSDHWNFAKNNIPIIFYFDGIHEDYHMPGDEVDKIEFDLLARRAQCVFYTAWEIANREEKIKPDGAK